jgi:methionyl-tRNA synthetase
MEFCSMTDQSAPESPQPEPPQPSAPPSADKPLIPYDVFAQVDLRVATVLEAREHPNANKLLLLQIQVGDVRKQIVAGIRGHYEPAALVGRQIIIVNNLEPAMLRGEESNGMLLAATDEKGVVLLRPDREMTSGSKVK